MPSSIPPSLTACSLEQLTELMKTRGLQSFRAKQIWDWVWKKGVVSYDEMTNLSKELRERLAADLPVVGLSVSKVQKSKRDGTAKALLSVARGQGAEVPGPRSPAPGPCIEAVAMPDEETGRLSICVSTQIGCAMGCRFCASTVGGLKGSLSSAEILDQVLLMSNLAEERATNVVLMGMGEPLANYESSLEAVRRMNSPEFLGIGARHITVSTVGLVDEMARMSEEWPPVKLAVSLHAPNDQLRRKLIPIARKYTIIETLEVASGYAHRTSRHFTVEYILIAGLNAARKHAEELAALLRRLPAKVNLIAMNPGGAGEFSAPSEGRVKAFRDVLKERGIETTIRKRRGTDIEAACGQLRLREAD